MARKKPCPLRDVERGATVLIHLTEQYGPEWPGWDPAGGMDDFLLGFHTGTVTSMNADGNRPVHWEEEGTCGIRVRTHTGLWVFKCPDVLVIDDTPTKEDT